MEEVFSSCSSTSEPVILTVEGGELWVDFSAGEGALSAGGFQLSILSVPNELSHVSDAASGTAGAGRQMERIQKQTRGNNPQEQLLVKHLLGLLLPSVRNKEITYQREVPQTNPLIEVVEEPSDEEV